MALPRGRASFGGRMRALRMAKGLSQVDLARLIGRHQTVIGPYERDEYAPPREIVERLAGALDTSPEYLFFGRSPRRSTIEVVGDIGPLGSSRPSPSQPSSRFCSRTSGWRATGARRQHGALLPRLAARADPAGGPG